MSVYFYDEALVAKLKGWTGDSDIQIFNPDETRRLFETIADINNDKPIQLPLITLRRRGGYTVLNTNKKPLVYDGLTIDSTAGPFAKLTKKSKTISNVIADEDTYYGRIDPMADSEHVFTYHATGNMWTLDKGTKSINLTSYGIMFDGTPTDGDTITIKVTQDDGKSLQLNAIPITIPYQLDVYTRYYKEADMLVRNLIFNIINYPTLKIVIPYNNSNLEHYANIYMSSEITDNSDVQEVAFKTGQFSRMSINIDIDDAYLWDARIRDNVSINPDIEE